MPGSMPEGKAFIKDFLINLPISRILDVGPGSGNYYDLLNGLGEYTNYTGGTLNEQVEWLAVEIFPDYVNIFNLNSKYDQIFFSDIYDLDWNTIGGKVDVVILGDVLEHMSEDRGALVIHMAADYSDYVVLSLPIIDYPQGESWGNIHEAHVAQYDPLKIKKLLKGYDIIASFEGEVIGVYIFRSKYPCLV